MKKDVNELNITRCVHKNANRNFTYTKKPRIKNRTICNDIPKSMTKPMTINLVIN